MSLESIPAADGISLIDTEMFGQSGFTAAYLFRSQRNLLVDAGLFRDGATVEEDLHRAGLGPGDLDYLVVSHLHLDHAGGITYLAGQFPEARILGHPLTVEYLSDPKKLRRLFASGQDVMSAFGDGYGEAEALDEDRLGVLEDEDVIHLGDRKIRVFHAPGHAPHQICFYDESNDAIHLVDEGCALLGEEPYPTTPPPDFDLDQTLESLDRFSECSPELLLYSHFGYREGGSELLENHKDLLRYWVELIDEYRGGARPQSDVVDQVLEEFAGAVPENFREILKRDVRGVYEYLEDRAGTN